MRGSVSVFWLLCPTGERTEAKEISTFCPRFGVRGGVMTRMEAP